MTGYTVFPFNANAACLTFDAAELPDDASAERRAAELFFDHSNAVEIAIWQGERFVSTTPRPLVHRRLHN